MKDFSAQIKSKLSNLTDFLGEEYNDITTKVQENVDLELGKKPRSSIETLEKCNLILDLCTFVKEKTTENPISTVEMFKGGHVMIELSPGVEDWYVKFKEHYPNRKKSDQENKATEQEKGGLWAYKRISSHHKNYTEVKKNPQLGIDTDFAFKQLLIGKTVKNGKEYVWFQFENSPVKDIKSFILHMLDFFKYVFTGKNIGQYGSSKHVERNPIIIEAEGVRPHKQAVKMERVKT